MIVSELGPYNLVLLLIVFGVMVLAGYGKRIKRTIVRHAGIMTLALAVTVVSVVAIMLPSSATLSAQIWSMVDTRFTTLLVHELVGIAALIMGAVLTGSWLIRGRRPNSCLGKPKNKRMIMRATLLTWTLALLMGLAAFLQF